MFLLCYRYYSICVTSFISHSFRKGNNKVKFCVIKRKRHLTTTTLPATKKSNSYCVPNNRFRTRFVKVFGIHNQIFLRFVNKDLMTFLEIHQMLKYTLIFVYMYVS